MRRILLLAVISLGLILTKNPTFADGGLWDDLRNDLADFNNDCVINVFDTQAVSFRWGANSNSLLYNTRYDNVPYWYTGFRDWDIDIGDLQFVSGRYSLACIDLWDPQTSMGMYSLGKESESDCEAATEFNQIPSSRYVDPISVVFFANSTQVNLGAHAQHHGLPVLEGNGEQRFWEIKVCSFEDVDAGENSGGCIPPPFGSCLGLPDVWERWHMRAEVAYRFGHRTWGRFAVATPHFDDDDNTCGHFVPEVFPYPDEIYPGFQGSGFDAGREWVYQQFVIYGGHGFAGSEYWGNRTPIKQSCGGNQWPKSNGYVYFIEIP